MRDFYQTFLQLCKEKGVAPSNVAQEIGLNKSSVSYWKKGSIPKAETLKALAQYFNVTVDYLTGLDELEATIAREVNAPGEWKIRENSPLPARTVSDDDLKFALFGGGPVTDEQYEEVKRFARFIKERGIHPKGD